MTTGHAREEQPNIPPSTLRNRLRDAREWRGLEQIDIAKELGVGRSTISNYERGITEPNKLVINAWAVVCNVDVDWIRFGTTEPWNGPQITFRSLATVTRLQPRTPAKDRETLATVTRIGA